MELSPPLKTKPLTPEGNMSLVDNIDGEASKDKQFITIVSKNGNYFYIIIDRAGDGENTVHFLNQVDEADLLALMEVEEGPPAVCTCTNKCEAGAINTACAVCASNMTACNGKAQEPKEPEPPVKENKGGIGGLLVFLILVLAVGGGALYYFKFRKSKADVSGSTDLSEYDFDDEDELEEEQEDIR